MEQNIKERIHFMVDTYGSRYSFIAEKIGIHQGTLSRFMNGHQDFTPNLLKKIDEWLTSIGI